MRILCHRQSFLSDCQLVSGALSRDGVTRNIKAVVERHRCTLMATDLETGIRLERRNIKVEEVGTAILPAGRLLAILREATDEEMVIDASPEKVVVRGNTNEFDMPGETAELPDVPAFDVSAYHEFKDVETLRDMIRRTLFAAANAGNVRFGATTGVMWELDGDTAALVATDGRRLARATGQAVSIGRHATEGMPVVPAKTMRLLERNLAPNEPVRIAFRKNDCIMQTGQAVIYSRLVEGRFPNYKQVIPKNHNHRAPLTVGPVLAAVRQAAIMSDDDTDATRVRFQFARQKLTLRGQGAESGQSRIELPIDYDAGKKGFEISFNAAHVTEMLRVWEPDAALTLDMQEPETPAVFRNNQSYLYVVVPLAAVR